MGRRGSKNVPQPSGPWMQASLQRLQQHQTIRQDAATGVPHNIFVELGTRDRRAIASGEPVTPDEQPEYRTTEEVMAMVHRGGQEGLRPSGFSPDRHTVYICGRPVQVLVLTHEGSDTASWDMGSIQERFYPLRPHLLYGRAAHMEPKITVKQAVWYGWRDRREFSSNPISFSSGKDC